MAKQITLPDPEKVEKAQAIVLPDTASITLPDDTPVPQGADPEVFKDLPEWYRRSPMGQLRENMQSAGIYSREADAPVPEAGALAASVSHMMTDVYRGFKQMLGIDEEQMAQDQAVMTELYEDEELGAYAVTGAVIGALAEPVGFLVPVSKIKKAYQVNKIVKSKRVKEIAKTAAKGAATGAAFGAAGYVDEEAGQTRLENAAIGTVLGGVVGSGVGAYRTSKVNQGHKFIDEIESRWAEGIVSGRSPSDITAQLKEEIPNLPKLMRRSGANTGGRLAHLPMTTNDAKQLLESRHTLVKPNDLTVVADKIGGIVSTRVGNMSEAIKGRLRKYDHNVMQKTHDYLKVADKFLKGVHKIGGQDGVALHKALNNGDVDIAESIIKKHGGEELWQEYGKTMGIVDQLGRQLKVSGRLTQLIDNYFPRYVKDKEGLFSLLGRQEYSKIDKELAKARAKVGASLTPLQESEIINKALRGYPVEGYRPGFTRQRTIEELDEQMLANYASPAEALHTYIRNAVTDLEKTAFFGKDVKFKDLGGNREFDIDGSVGAVLMKERDKGLISANQETELANLLGVRFGIGESSPHKLTQGTKNILYMSLLSNPVSAATQFGDLGVAMYINGFRNTFGALSRKLTGRMQLTAKDLGLMDNMAEEFATQGRTARWLHSAFKWSGFKAVDQLGKDAIIQGSINKYRNLSRTMQGRGKISKKYREVFGDEYDALIDDLQNGRITENVKFLAYNEVANVQPTSLSEVPEGYLRLPNGRIMYMLKTFMLKQMDVIRRDSYQKIKQGNVAEGMANLMKYGILVGATNTGSQHIKDWMIGRDVESDLPADIGLNFLKTFAYSEYTMKMATGAGGRDPEPMKAIGNLVLPPYQVVDRLLEDGGKSAVQYMPVAGKIYYNWFGGGIEEWEAKERRRKLRERNERRERAERPERIR